jgi:hypothetical protein
MENIRIPDGKKSGSRMEKNPDPETGMNIPDNFSASLETVFKVKILKLFYADPRPGIWNIFDPRSGMEKF